MYQEFFSVPWIWTLELRFCLLMIMKCSFMMLPGDGTYKRSIPLGMKFEWCLYISDTICVILRVFVVVVRACRIYLWQTQVLWMSMHWRCWSQWRQICLWGDTSDNFLLMFCWQSFATETYTLTAPIQDKVNCYCFFPYVCYMSICSSHSSASQFLELLSVYRFTTQTLLGQYPKDDVPLYHFGCFRHLRRFILCVSVVLWASRGFTHYRFPPAHGRFCLATVLPPRQLHTKS